LAAVRELGSSGWSGRDGGWLECGSGSWRRQQQLGSGGGVRTGQGRLERMQRRLAGVRRQRLAAATTAGQRMLQSKDS